VFIIRSFPLLHMQPLVTVWCSFGCVLQPCSGYGTCSDLSVLKGSAWSRYSIQVDAFSNIGVFLSLVGKCWTVKVNELTSTFLLNWKNPQLRLFNYWLRLTMKIACLVHTCLNSTNDFWKADKAWKMGAQVVHPQLLAMTTLKKCEIWFEKTEDWVFEQ
jgi:hypothetical protein